MEVTTYSDLLEAINAELDRRDEAEVVGYDKSPRLFRQSFWLEPNVIASLMSLLSGERASYEATSAIEAARTSK